MREYFESDGSPRRLGDADREQLVNAVFSPLPEDDRLKRAYSEITRLRACLQFILEECDWEPTDAYGSGGDARIGPAVRKALGELRWHEPYRPAKELADELSKWCGRRVGEAFVRVLIRESGVRRIGRAARLSDLMAWWERHPDFKRRSKRKETHDPDEVVRAL